MNPSPPSLVAMDLTTARFDDAVTDHPTLVIAIRGHAPVSAGLAVTAELPVGHAVQHGGLSATALGNPWLGVEFNATRHLALEVGVRMSLATPETQAGFLPWAYGQVLDFDRAEAWLPQMSSARAVAHMGTALGSHGFLSGRAGFSGRTVSGGGGDGELDVLYGGRAGLRGQVGMVWLGVIGRGVITEETGSFGDRTVHQVEVGVAGRAMGVPVELTLRRYLAERFGGSVPVIVRVGIAAPL